MKYYFIHALVLTPFEASLTSLDWDILVEQDYPIHALYCQTTNDLLFLSNNQKNDCTEMISFLKQTFEILAIPAVYEQQILILRDDENAMDAQDVLKHFNH